MCEYLIVRLTTRRFGDIASVIRKRVLNFLFVTSLPAA